MSEEQIIVAGAYPFKLIKNEDGTYKSIPVEQAAPTPLPKEEKEYKPFTGKGVLAIFPSKSSPGDKHYVKYTSELGIFCTCIGNATHKHCWHADLIKEGIKQEAFTIEQLLKTPLEIKEA